MSDFLVGTTSLLHFGIDRENWYEFRTMNGFARLLRRNDFFAFAGGCRNNMEGVHGAKSRRAGLLQCTRHMSRIRFDPDRDGCEEILIKFDLRRIPEVSWLWQHFQANVVATD